MIYDTRIFVLKILITFFLLLFIICSIFLALLKSNEPSLVITERSFNVGNKVFLKDGEPYQILSGSIHYFRIVPERWDYVMKLAKKAGLNTIESYVPWGLHQPKNSMESVFTGLLDLNMFLRYAQQNGLNVILKIGPYNGGELNYGGLPIWLMENFTQTRTNTEEYMFYVSNWLSKLSEIVVPFLYHNGGNVIMIQVENQYGATRTCNTNYLKILAGIFRTKFPNTLLTTADACKLHNLICGNGNHITGLLATIDLGYNEDVAKCFQIYRQFNPSDPIFVSQIQTGAFSTYGGARKLIDARSLNDTIREVLAHEASLNFYVFMGGTNYGYESGSFNQREQIITSHDLDGPLNEGANKMEKYYIIKKALQEYLKINETKESKDFYLAGSYGEIPPSATVSILNFIKKSPHIYNVNSADWLELSSLYNGYAVYFIALPEIINPEVFNIDSARDEAVILIDGSIVGQTKNGNFDYILNSSNSRKTMTIVLQLFGHQTNSFNLDCKYLGDVKIGKHQFNNWFRVPFILDDLTLQQSEDIIKHESDAYQITNQPVISYAELNIIHDNISDTYLDLRPCYSSGYVFVNSFNIGYFNNLLPPQYTLYIPNSILKLGINKIVIFDFHGLNTSISYKKCKLSFLSNPIWGA